jgi:ATP:cob(I)alamin adenosyltransferase
MKIYTKGGDKGRTGIRGGRRVEKDDIRIEANGTLDELNAQMGVVRAWLPADHEWQEVLRALQREMMAVMSHVATPSDLREKNPNVLSDSMTAFCEQQIDALTARMGDNSHFILPSGTPVSAHLHLARTVARRAERRLCTLHHADPLPPSILPFINRLSDLFFVMARYDTFRHGEGEEQWKPFR